MSPLAIPCSCCGVSLAAHRIDRRQIACAEVLQRAGQLDPEAAFSDLALPDVPDEIVQAVRVRIAAALDAHDGGSR